MGDVKRRVDWVDSAKGLCIIFVVMMHSTLGVEKQMGVTSWMGDIVAFAKPFRMPDFFLISGLFLASVLRRDWLTFLDRRVVHFLYFYVIWLTIQFAFKAPSMVNDYGAAATFDLYVRSLFYEPFGTLWFIWILPVFAVVLRLTIQLPKLLVFALAAGLEMAHVSTGIIIIDEFSSRFVYFFVGYAAAPLFFQLADLAVRHIRLAMTALAFWAVGEAVMVFGGWSELSGLSLILGLLGASAIVTLASLINQTTHAGRLFRYLGENSIVVYLGFFLPMAVTRELLVRSGIIPDVGTMALITTLAGISITFVMLRVARDSGFGFLYVRPAIFHIDHWTARRRPGASTVAAE